MNFYGINITTANIQKHFLESTFSTIKLNIPELYKYFEVRENILFIEKSININSYIAADIADFLRVKMVEAGITFTYETVMSDSRKIDFIYKAKQAGYKIYLYYIATEDPSINILRIKNRVLNNGHFVSDDKVISRYTKSLGNLKAAVLASDRAYIFDSTNDIMSLISEITNGTNVEILAPEFIPNWFIEYLVEAK